MADEDGPEDAGWHPAPDEPPGFIRYWDGTRWIGDPVPLRQSSEVFQYARAHADEEAFKRSGAREGEGVPFHELYLRRKSKKHNWKPPET